MALVAQGPQTSSTPGAARVEASTSSTAAAIAPLADAPLSAEELALLAALAEAPPAPPPPSSPDPWGTAPDALGARRFDGLRLRETAGRSVAEASRALPALSGDYRWGARSPVLWNGLLLQGRATRALWLRADPHQVGGATFVRGPDRSVLSEDLGGRLELVGRRAELDRALSAEVAAVLRTADRAAGAQLDAQWGARRFAARVFGSVQHEDDLRVRGLSSTSTLAEQGPRFDLGAELRAVPIDGFELDAQLLLSAESQLSSPTPLSSQRGLLLSLGARVGTSSQSIELRAGYTHSHLEDGLDDERALQARLRALYVPTQGLRLSAGGFVLEGSQALGRAEPTSTRELAGHGQARLDLGRWFAQAGLRICQLKVGARSAWALLPQADLMVLLAGDPEAATGPVGEGLAFKLRGARGLDLVGDGAQHSWRIRGGPSLRLRGLWLDLQALYARVDPGPTEDAVQLWGVELDGGLRLVEGLHLNLGAGWAEGAADAQSVARFATPNLRGHLALRYTMAPRHTYFELRVRASGPRWTARSAALMGDDPAYGFVQVGLAGGLDLGTGFRLEATVDNALDRRIYDLATFEPAPGLDLRVRLSWRPT